MDVEMIGGRVIRVLAHDPLEDCAKFWSSCHRFPLQSPVVPRLHADHSLCGPDLNVRVHREAGHDLFHGGKVGLVLFREILRKAADALQNKLTRAQYLDEVTWTTKSWLGLQKQRISVVLHTAIAEQVVNELASGGGGRVHGAKCLATLAGVA